MLDPLEAPIRIIILTPYPLVRSGLRLLIEQQEDMQVVGESEDSLEGLAIVAREKPEIILLQVTPEGSAVQEIIPSLIKSLGPGTHHPSNGKK